MSTIINRILCPVDLSENSRHALEQAVALAREHQARVTAVHAFAIAPVTRGLPSGMPTVLEPARLTPPMRAALDEELLDFLAPVQSAGVVIDRVITEGETVDAIMAESARLRPDLLVMGTHGRSGLKRLVLGSVAEAVLRRAPCPVLTVPPRAEGSTSITFSRVLCGVDFSSASIEALAYASAFAPRAELTALHVVQLARFSAAPGAEIPPDVPELRQQLTADAWERLKVIVPDAVRATGKVRDLVRVGRPSGELLQLAADERCDLIVLGVEPRSVAGRLLFGSTTDRIVREAACPVLTVLAHS